MSNTKVSITIPVYNVEKYIKKCLDSVLSQTYKNWECILIDDGSTDSSKDICDEYADKDSRIKVMHKSNGGLASARQCGIDNSRGEYVITIDSDDWVEENHIEIMVNAIENSHADIVMFDYLINKKNEQEYRSNKPSSLDIKDVECDSFTHKIHTGLWCKIFKRSLFTDYNVIEAPGSYYEDMYSFISCIENAKRIHYVSKATYHYRMNPTSMTNDNNRFRRYKMYKEAMANFAELDKLYNITKDSDKRNAFEFAIDICRGEIIIKYCLSHPIEVYKLLNAYLVETCNLKTVKDKESLYMYLAVHWGILLPYQLRVLKAKLLT